MRAILLQFVHKICATLFSACSRASLRMSLPENIFALACCKAFVPRDFVDCEMCMKMRGVQCFLTLCCVSSLFVMYSDLAGDRISRNNRNNMPMGCGVVYINTPCRHPGVG